MRSSVFQASAADDITLNDILTNSAIRFPVHVSLSRALAENVGLAGSTPTNQLLVALPDFLTMGGSIGKPEKHVNGMALAAVALKAGVGVASQIGGAAGGQVGGILGAVGGLLGGNPQPGTAAPNSAPAATNAPTANPQAQQPNNVLDLFKKPPKSAGTNTSKATTNAPASNTQTQQQINVLDLFKKPKKQ